MNANKLGVNYNTRLCQCQIELKKLIRIIPSVVQHNYYLRLMFITCCLFGREFVVLQEKPASAFIAIEKHESP